MNETLQSFARFELKNNLALCSIAEQNIFKAMYAHNHSTLTINDVVDKMDEEKLDWAMTQVETTIKEKIK